MDANFSLVFHRAHTLKTPPNAYSNNNESYIVQYPGHFPAQSASHYYP